MNAERVDKQWKTKGLAGYSTAAILGTLNHYGVKVDEDGFKTLSEKEYPLQIAGGWKLVWKGTGPFSPFPYAAAEELMRRLAPGKVTPAHLAEKIVTLLAGASELLSGKADALSESSMAEVEGLVATLPPAGELRTLFTSELVDFLDRFATAFEHLPTTLQERGHTALALRAANLQESIFLDRRGIVTALLEARSGARDAGVAKLSELVGPAEGRTLFTRYWALDALAQLDANDALKEHGVPLFDLAAAENRWPLADSIVHLLARALEGSPTMKADPAFVEAVVSRFEEAHRRVGHHGH